MGKRCAETLFFDYRRQHGLRIKVARIFNTYGPRMQRLITALIMPLPFGLGLAGVGLAMLAASRRWRLGVLLVGAGLATILLAALPVVAQALMATLEVPYPPRPAAACPRAEAIPLSHRRGL